MFEPLFCGSEKILPNSRKISLQIIKTISLTSSCRRAGRKKKGSDSPGFWFRLVACPPWKTISQKKRTWLLTWRAHLGEAPKHDKIKERTWYQARRLACPSGMFERPRRVVSTWQKFILLRRMWWSLGESCFYWENWFGFGPGRWMSVCFAPLHPPSPLQDVEKTLIEPSYERVLSRTSEECRSVPFCTSWRRSPIARRGAEICGSWSHRWSHTPPP